MKHFVFLMACILVCDILAVASAKKWALTQNNLFLAGTILGFALTGFFFTRMLKYEGMVIANILWMALAVVLTTLMGVFVFHEKISGVQWAGMVLACIGVVLMNISNFSME